MKSNIVIFIFCLVFLNSCSYKRKLTAKKITLSPLYSSGMVIQTSPHTLIKGSADPNSVLAARISDYVRLITTDSEGRWQVTFPEIILKKPFSIFIEGLDTLIEAGFIWKCYSGQGIQRRKMAFRTRSNS